MKDLGPPAPPRQFSADWYKPLAVEIIPMGVPPALLNRHPLQAVSAQFLYRWSLDGGSGFRSSPDDVCARDVVCPVLFFGLPVLHEFSNAQPAYGDGGGF